MQRVLLLIYIFRMKGGLSRPCMFCFYALRMAGIRRVVCEDEYGEIEKREI